MNAVYVRAPLRISLGGGGTDLPSYYARRPGFVVSAAIDRYVHVAVGPAPGSRHVLRHLEREEVEDAAAIKHPILREAIGAHWRDGPLELRSCGDVEPGTGLGSSGAYAVAAVAALRLAAGEAPSPAELAAEAARIEIGVMGRTVGKQDGYAAAHGGLRAYEFAIDESVTTRELDVGEPVLEALRERFLLFDTGERRSASDLLARQATLALDGDEEMLRNLDRTRAVAVEVAAALEAGQLGRLAELMAEQWQLKRARSPAIVTERAAALQAAALDAGGRAALIVGAGGGGHLLVYSDDPERTRAALDSMGASELRFGLDRHGCIAPDGEPPPGARLEV